MATCRLDITSDEIINIKCCVCMANNRTREAEMYCVECRDYYCSICSVEHKNFPALRSHKLLNEADFRSQGPNGSLPSFVIQRCVQHQSEIVNMFCKEHNDVVCATCVATNHRFCAQVHDIHEEIDKLYNKAELNNLKQKIYKTKKNMEKFTISKEWEVKALKEVYSKEVESVKAFRNELQKLLDNLEQETIRKLKQEFERIESCLKSEINEFNTLIDAINEVSSKLNKAEGNNCQEFVSIKSSEKVTTKANNVRRENQKKTVETVQFNADQILKTFLQQMKTFGSVSSIEVCKTDKLYKVKNRREINVKLANDTCNCFIIGSCLMDDKDLLLVDHNNNKLKRINMSTEAVKDYLCLEAPPRSVCLVSMTEAAIALNNNNVTFVSLGSKLSATRSLKINHVCYGLAYMDGKLIISDRGNSVYIHDINGIELQRISKNAAGNEIFQNTRHITISDDEERVFVADYDNGMIILDIQGKYLSTLTDPELSWYQGVCTEGKNLFVCGCSSGNIVQIGQDYQVLGEVCNVRQPYSLSFDSNKTTLIVTNYSDNITLFELE